ncbi:MAG TPA: hypothetical protein VMW94_07115 [Actinomycetes bacterium]|nr:hypothetical protein [Actinomycetes bacterium]
MPADAQFALAIIGGLGFGAIINRLGSSPQRLALILVLLWTMQTGPQFIYRWLDGFDVTDEVLVVTSLRLTFTIAAVSALWFMNRWEVSRHGI